MPVNSQPENCARKAEGLTFGRLGGIFVWKGKSELEQTAFPDCLLSSGNAHIPHLEIDDPVVLADRFGEEAEWVIFAPLLPLLAESIETQTHGGSVSCSCAIVRVDEEEVSREKWRVEDVVQQVQR